MSEWKFQNMQKSGWKQNTPQMKNSPLLVKQKDHHGDKEAGSGARRKEFKSWLVHLLVGDLAQVLNFPVTLENGDNKKPTSWGCFKE